MCFKEEEDPYPDPYVHLPLTKSTFHFHRHALWSQRDIFISDPWPHQYRFLLINHKCDTRLLFPF